MADYYPLLTRALEGVPDPTPDVRRNVYERARAALIAQMRNLNPPIADADIMRECLALDDAVQRIEQYFAPLPAKPAFAQGDPDYVQESDQGYDQGYDRNYDQPYDNAYECAHEPFAAQPGPADTGGARHNWNEAPATDLRVQNGGGYPEPAQPERRGRPRVALQPPSTKQGARKRGIILFATILSVVAVIAGLAIWMKFRDSATTQDAPPPVAAAPEGDTEVKPKNAERVDGSSPTPVTSILRGSSSFSQRAILLEGIHRGPDSAPPRPEDPPYTTVGGGASWKLDAMNVGEGKPLETVIRGHVEFPNAQLAADILIQRNLDPTLNASHLIMVTISGGSSLAERKVAMLESVNLRSTPENLSRPLHGVITILPINESAFILALFKTNVDLKTNIEILTTFDWFEMPITYASGQKAAMMFEKGTEGKRVFEEAFRDWNARPRTQP